MSEKSTGSISWTAVLSRVRRAVRARRAAAAGACAVVLVLVAVAFASASGNGQRRVSVVGAANTTTTASAETTTSSTLAPDTTTAPSAPETVPVDACLSCEVTTTMVQNPLPAQAGDFTGSLDHYRNVCDPCDFRDLEKGITLTIRNTTDHAIDLSTAAPVRVAVVCSTNMTSEGYLTAPLPAYSPNIFVDLSLDNGWHPSGSATYDAPGTSLAPGAEATNDPVTAYTFAGLDPGTATCEGAIVATSDGTWKPETLSVVARLTNLPTYSFQLVADATTTTRPPTTTRPSTTTTAPETTTS